MTGKLNDQAISLLIKNIYLSIEKKIVSMAPKVLNRYPIDERIAKISLVPDYSGYSYLGDDTVSTLNSIATEYGYEAEALYCQLIALRFLKASTKKIGKGFLPSTLESLYLQWINRILGEFPLDLKGLYHKNDLFLKYLSVCSLRSVPVGGAWIAELSGITKRFIITGGLRQFLKASLFLPFKMKGFKPFYQIHMVQSMKDLVNPEARIQCYKGVAQLLKNNSQVKGLFAGSWYYDPVIHSISPRLSYMSESAVISGAGVFKIGSSISDVNNATQTSPTRKKLYNEGQYLPTTYLLIWPRRSLLQWAENN